MIDTEIAKNRINKLFKEAKERPVVNNVAKFNRLKLAMQEATVLAEMTKNTDADISFIRSNRDYIDMYCNGQLTKEESLEYMLLSDCILGGLDLETIDRVLNASKNTQY